MRRRRILQVFNRYVFMGGEEKSVDRIYSHLCEDHEVARCFFESKDWTRKGAPGKLGQLRRTIYNRESRTRFEQAIDGFKPDFALFHNTLPVGSPSLYHAAVNRGLPVIHYAHNFRPLSVGGTLYAGGGMLEEALHGNYWREVRYGAWQGSVMKSAVMALALKLLHKSGWLRCVKAWVCISEFMRDKFIEGGIPRERVHTLRHAWEPMLERPRAEDGGYYLFLSRLVDVKGVEMLIKAWDRMAVELGKKPPELQIAGEGPLEHMVRDAAASNPHVRFLGMISGDAKRDALRCCRAVMIPSLWWEPFGLVACEAYDHGKPVIAAASGGLTETVRDGVTGFLHPPGDVNELVREVIAMDALPAERRAAMGAAGRQWLLENTGVERWKQRFEGIMARALQNS